MKMNYETVQKLVKKFPHLSKAILALNTRLGLRGRKGSRTVWVNNGVFSGSRIDVLGTGNEINIGLSRLKNCSIFIRGNNNHIRIGDRCYLSGVSLYIEDDNGTIDIGNHTTIYEDTQLAVIEGKRIVVGKDSLISSHVQVRTGYSHSILDLSGQRINPSQDVTIGKHVWIGTRSTILKGAAIGENSIVSTGSIVTKKFDTSNCILGGVPSKIIKENVNWCAKRIKTVP